MGARTTCTWWVTLVCLIGGCEGRVDAPQLDGEVRDNGVVSVESGTCTPESQTTYCNPITSVECAPGAACYLVQGSHLDCVCPAGTAAEGDSCNTATDCEAGHTCFSATSTPPGACRLLCEPQIPVCPGNHSCRQLQNWPQLGYCDPSG
jgi:hypothetical protein